jgi:hypothetical protein
VKEEEYGGRSIYTCMKMEQRPVEVVLKRGRGMKEKDGGNESNVYFKYVCKHQNITLV